jgi:CheY-like chemotaxis protein
MAPETCDILIVDDSAEVLLAAELVLKKKFRSVVTTADPNELPALLARHSFDVILLDMNYTLGAGGYRLAQEGALPGAGYSDHPDDRLRGH